MQINRVQNYNNNHASVKFGTKFSPEFINKFKFATEKGLVKSEAINNIKTLLNDGLDDVTISIKKVKSSTGGQHDVVYVQNEKLENLIKNTKDIKSLYYDKKYYDSIQNLKNYGIFAERGGYDRACDGTVSTVFASAKENNKPKDIVHSMISAMHKQSGFEETVAVDGMETEFKDMMFKTNEEFFKTLNKEYFGTHFRNIYENIIENLEKIHNRMNELSTISGDYIDKLFKGLA